MLRRIALTLCLTVVMCASALAPAVAAPPLLLDSGPVTDDAGVIGNDTAPADALAQLNTEHGIQLFVVYVDSFDGMNSQEWADETAEINGLGLNDILLAIAVGDRQYAWSVDQDFTLDDDELELVAADSIEPQLQADDWAGAAIAGAEGYAEVLADRSTSDGGTTGSGSSWCLLVGLVAAVGAAAAFFIAKRRRGPGQPAAAGQGQPDMKSLETKAGQLLVGVDEALRTSEQELGFAEAEFGATAVTEYRSALEDSKKEVAEAFRIQQSVYDSEPEDDATRRQMLEKIISLAETADARLDEKAEGFARLRDISGRADEVLTAAAARLDAVQAAVPAAAATIRELNAAYAPGALGEVADDDVQATQLLAAARDAIEQGNAATAAGDSAAAAMSARTAEDSVAQAALLLEAVEAARKQLEQAQKDLTAETSALEQVAAAAESQGSAELVPLIASARRVAAEARSAADAPPFDPPARLAQVREAAAQLDAALGAARDAAESAQAARATATAVIASTRDRIASTEAFIATRHSAVGPQARTSLSEAKNRLVRTEQLVGTDPAAALVEAQAAQQYADSASRYAQSDVAATSRGPSPASTTPSVDWARAAGAVASGFGGSGGRRSGSGSGSSASRSGSRSKPSSTRRGGGGRF